MNKAQVVERVCPAHIPRCPRFNKIAAFKNIAKAATSRLTSLNLHHTRKWSAEDYVCVLAYSWIRGVSVEHASNKLNQWGLEKHPELIEEYADGRHARAVPHQTSVNDWLRKLSREDAQELSEKVLEAGLKRFFCKNGRSRKVVLQFDLTYLGYWGRRRDKWIKGSRMVKGTRRIRHYHGALVHGAGASLFVGIYHVAKHQSKISFMIQTAQKLLAMGLEVEFCVVDREYYRYSVLAEFKKLGIDVITPAKNYDQLKGAKVDYLLGEKKRIQTFSLSETTQKGKNAKKIKCWVVLLPRGNQRLDRIKSDYRRGNQTIYEASDQIYGLITAKAPQYAGSRFPLLLKKIYKMRWQIETAFRDNEVHKGIWRSNHDGTRFMGELGRYLMYNMWQEARVEDPRGERLTFQMFRDELVDVVSGRINL